VAELVNIAIWFELNKFYFFYKQTKFYLIFDVVVRVNWFFFLIQSELFFLFTFLLVIYNIFFYNYI